MLRARRIWHAVAIWKVRVWGGVRWGRVVAKGVPAQVGVSSSLWCLVVCSITLTAARQHYRVWLTQAAHDRALVGRDGWSHYIRIALSGEQQYGRIRAAVAVVGIRVCVVV